MTPEELRTYVRALLGLSEVLLGHLERTALLDQSIGYLRDVLAVDSVEVLLLEPDGKSLSRAPEGAGRRAQRAQPVPVGETVIGDVAASRTPLIVDSVRDLETPEPSFTGLSSVMAAPLTAGDELFGVIQAGSATPRNFSDSELHFLQAAAERLGLAMRNAERHSAGTRENGERERMRAQLAEAESRQKLLAETAADSIVTIDAESRIVSANPAAAATFGYELDELIGRSFTDLIPERFRAGHRAGVARYVATGERHLRWSALELPGLHRSGREIPLEVSFAEGIFQGRQLFTGTMRDIGERKRTERVLAAQYATTRVLADSPSVEEAMPEILAGIGESLGWHAGGYWAWDDEAQALRVTALWTAPSVESSEFAAARQGQTFEAGIGLPGQVWRDGKHRWIPDLQAATEFPRLQDAAKLGLRSGFAFPICISGDCLGVIELFTLEHTDQDEAILSAMDALGSDIGQFIRRREAEARVEEQERIQRFFAKVGTTLSASALDYDATLRSLAHLAVPTLADWCSVEVRNADGAIERVGIAHGDPSKADIAAELEAYPERIDPEGPASQVFETGKPVVIPVITDEMIQSAAQDPRHLELLRSLGIRSAMVVPLVARDRTLGTLTLVSEPRSSYFSDRSLELAEEFARRAAVALDNARLYRESQEANRAKAEFLATVSHELRTPLNAIIGYADLLGMDVIETDAARAKGYAGRIGVSARHLSQLIEEVLAFSRMESGRESIAPEELVLQELLEEIRIIAEPLASAKGLTLSVDRRDPPVEMITDAGKVRQILLNIVGNAIKFTEEGGVDLSWTYEGDHVLIRVRDTGIGIAKENLERIFDPFWQVEQGTTRSVGGTGLGLTVSRRLAVLLGGQVTVVSAPGAGTTVTVYLPLRSERVSHARGGDRRRSHPDNSPAAEG